MTNLSLLSLLILLIGPVSFRSCDNIITPPEPINEIIYSNSFETVKDTVGWYGFIGISNDAPRTGGTHSAYVAGGCLHPHTWYNLKAFKQDSYLMIKCWGKNLSNGGGVELEAVPEVSIPENPKRYIFITISDKFWRSYQSDSILFCPANSKLILSMSSGGYVPSSMLVDLIEIIRVK
ncbi:MAG: hypothetical protein HY964_10045 [Ignavibacteriales bacterium]|nr:hypothetical protein [Ignavibacteriales bacterium]